MPNHRDAQRTAVSRRDLLRTGSAAVVGASLGCGPVHQAGQAPPSAVSPPFELEELTLDQLQDGMQRGVWSARTAAEAYLARIDELDARGPALRAVLEVNPDALAIADELDRERREAGPRGPLHGVPVLLKDNIDTADRMTTTAGSLALVGSIAEEDSEVAGRLRRAGAVLLGKANLSEWANFRSTRSSSGWSARGGQCRNPYALDRNPCGSSSGSAVAVAANLAMIAIGTETNGSIVCPASANALVGIKPTVGLVSQAGIVPIAHSQDTAGPMTRTVRDAALTLVAIGSDEAWQANQDGQATSLEATLGSMLDPDGLRGARVGVARRFFGFHRHTDRVIEDALDVIRQAGATVVDPVEWPSAPIWNTVEQEVLLYEFKTDLDAYLATRGPDARVRSLDDVIAFNEQHRDQVMAFFGQELFYQAAAKGPLTEPRYLAALGANRRLAREDGIDLMMDRYELDALVAPTGGPAWTTDLINGDHFSGGSARPAATAGYPHITVPAGDVFGLPIGLSFFGRAWSEPTLIRLAFAFEQLTKNRRPPRFLETVELPPRGED